MDDVDPSLEWVRIDVGFLDNPRYVFQAESTLLVHFSPIVPSLDVLLKYVARYSTYRPAFIGLVGSLSRNAVLDGRPEIHAILNNTLPVRTGYAVYAGMHGWTLNLQCYILNRRPKDLDYIPSVSQCLVCARSYMHLWFAASSMFTRNILQSAISVYNRFGTETFYLRVNGRNLDVLENPERREFLTDKDPADVRKAIYAHVLARWQRPDWRKSVIFFVVLVWRGWQWERFSEYVSARIALYFDVAYTLLSVNWDCCNAAIFDLASHGCQIILLIDTVHL